jgi:hypothetical protein
MQLSADNLVADDTNGLLDVFVYERTRNRPSPPSTARPAAKISRVRRASRTNWGLA